MPFALIILLAIGLATGLMGLQADLAYGHGGEDHGETTSQQHQGPTTLGLGNGAQGDLYEALIIQDDTGQLWIYLSDAKTNAPVTNATIDVEATGNPGWTHKGESTSAVGVYQIGRTLPPNATVDLTVTVTTADGSDLILIQEPSGNVGTDHRGVTLPKASQFLLDVRTVPAEQRNVTQTIRLVGHVIPDPAFYARIHPPVASRIIHDPTFPPPRSGQKVKRGQTLAVLDPLLSNMEKTGQRLSLFKGEQGEAFTGRELVLAPMDGQLTDVHIIPGDVAVEADILAEIIDPDHLWVEAVLYDLSMADRITAATAASRQIPGQSFSLTLMGVSPKVNPENQGLHLQFAIDQSGTLIKPGMPMDVYAHTGAALFAVAIPRQAILEQGGIPRVWVKTAPEAFVGRSVRIGRKTADWVEILEGIQPGDKVVVQGHNQLNAMR